MELKLYVDDLSFSYDTDLIIENIHLEVPEGRFVGIVGPNGSGKSTILKCIYGALVPKTGMIRFDGIDTGKLKHKQRATILAVVGQENSVPFNFTVREIVAMGRTPHKGLFEPDSDYDRQMVNEAMEIVGITEYADRDYSNLSGGEKQRVLIARALAQETEFLILDEPTNHLDINYQMQILSILKNSGRTVLSVVHDLNLAAIFCDDIYVLDEKHVVSHGTADEVLTETMINKVFHVECDITINPHTGRKNIVFIPNA